MHGAIHQGVLCTCSDGRSVVQSLVDIVKHGLVDENQKVKTITALTIAALAEAAAPYGIESFDDVLEPLWKGIRLLRGKVSLLKRCCTSQQIPTKGSLTHPGSLFGCLRCIWRSW